ncbi:MAG: MFS transporter [Chloroflexi bacterium]|nr:MFS transporter [Chloroflexota bacterium]
MYIALRLNTLIGEVRAARPNYGWAVIAVVFASMAISIGGSHYAFGLFVVPLEDQFGWSRTQVNAALSFSAIAGLTAPLVGRALDRIGARPVMSASLLLLAISFLLRPLITDLWQWYALSFLQFLGFPGASILAGPRLVSAWFPETRGRMMGVSSMGANFGGLTLPLLLGVIISRTDWRWGFTALGIMAAVIALLSFLLIKEGPSHGTRASDAATAPPIRSRTSRRLDPASGATVNEALHSTSFYALTLAIVAATFTYSAVLTQIIPHLQNEGLSLTRATLFLSLLAVFGMVGKLSFGYLTERFLARYVFMISLAIQSLCLIALILGPDTPALWIALPFFGIGIGGMGTTLPILVQDTVGMKNFGAIYGLVTLATIASSLLGPLLAGVIFDSRGNYDLAFLIIIGIFAFGAAVSRLARPWSAQPAFSPSKS